MNRSGVLVMRNRPGSGPEMPLFSLTEVFSLTEATSNAGRADCAAATSIADTTANPASTALRTGLVSPCYCEDGEAAATVGAVSHITVPEGVPGIRSLFAFRPEVAQPLSVLADVLLHADNSLSRGERELIAAYVSSLNDCEFCHRSHAAVASCHLGDEGSTVTAVVRDAHSAPVSPKMKALLAI